MNIVEYSFHARDSFRRNSFVARITRPDGRMNLVTFGPNCRPTEGTAALVADLTKDAAPGEVIECNV